MPKRAVIPPAADPDIARLAGVLADASRVAMLDVLLDGEAHAIGVLARRAGVSASTASSHLVKLAEARMVIVESVGRERHVRLANADVAHMLEQLAALAASPRTHTAFARRRADELRFARTCYDHLAGVLGVLVTTGLVDRGWVREGDLAPSAEFSAWLAVHGQPIEDSKRPVSRACLDWSERVPHLAGAAGAALASVCMGQRWVSRVRDGRALRVTTRGRNAFADELGITLPR